MVRASTAHLQVEESSVPAGHPGEQAPQPSPPSLPPPPPTPRPPAAWPPPPPSPAAKPPKQGKEQAAAEGPALPQQQQQGHEAGQQQGGQQQQGQPGAVPQLQQRQRCAVYNNVSWHMDVAGGIAWAFQVGAGWVGWWGWGWEFGPRGRSRPVCHIWLVGRLQASCTRCGCCVCWVAAAAFAGGLVAGCWTS